MFSGRRLRVDANLVAEASTEWLGGGDERVSGRAVPGWDQGSLAHTMQAPVVGPLPVAGSVVYAQSLNRWWLLGATLKGPLRIWPVECRWQDRATGRGGLTVTGTSQPANVF
jgi:hypothetical protein